MKIVLIGAGNVATHLAQALKSRGEEILQIYSQDLNHAKFLADGIPCEPVNDWKLLKTNADLYIIAVKDDAIESIADQLKTVNGLVVHTSGTTDIQVLSSKVKHPGVLYPLQTFSKSKAISFEDIPLCIEAANEADLSILQSLASKLSQKVYHLGGDQRKVLHLSAVFACNFTNHLYALAHQLLQVNHLDFEIIRPLIKETADKVMMNLPENVQTGPAVRVDETTLNKHLSKLNHMPELQHIYQTLSDSIKLMHK